LVAEAKFLVEATKDSFVIPNFVAATKPFFSVSLLDMVDSTRAKDIPEFAICLRRK